MRWEYSTYSTETKNCRRKKCLMALIPQHGTVKKAMSTRRLSTHLPKYGVYFPVKLGKLRISSIAVNALNCVPLAINGVG